MDIKLRARLSAYSKVDAVRATIDDIPTISNSDIDGLFPGRVESAVSKGKIDTLFAEDKKPMAVDKAAIDTLFDGQETKTTAVDKATIDTLFDGEESTVGRVSYAAIDSLFDKR